jgi:hypothetical protein
LLAISYSSICPDSAGWSADKIAGDLNQLRCDPSTQASRTRQRRLINQHIQYRRPLAELSTEEGISLRCAFKWLLRNRTGVPIAVVDRRSVRLTQYRTLDLLHLELAGVAAIPLDLEVFDRSGLFGVVVHAVHHLNKPRLRKI